MKKTAYIRYSWGVLGYTIAVILWGAYVRATGSGAGCGSHWPLCNGEVIPISPRIETLVEFTHRVSSGLTLVLVVGLVIWAFVAFPGRHPARLGACVSGILVMSEVAVGAGVGDVVVFGGDASGARGL